MWVLNKQVENLEIGPVEWLIEEKTGLKKQTTNKLFKWKMEKNCSASLWIRDYIHCLTDKLIEIFLHKNFQFIYHSILPPAQSSGLYDCDFSLNLYDLLENYIYCDINKQKRWKF